MASYNQREICPSLFTPKTPHFFKIILKDTIRDRKLRIPRKFVRTYGNGLLSSPVLLMVPDGAKWHVELTESDGDVWLQNGWHKFAEHYSLQHGHFLVFRYEGNCSFQVIIFDTSASEVEYPRISLAEDQRSDEECQEPKRKEAKDETSVEILHETPPARKKKEKSRSPCSRCSRPRKKLRTTSTHKNKRDCEDVSLGDEGDLQTEVPSGGHSFGANEHATALQRACAFQSENSFFVVEMQPSYINPGRKMCLPINFIRTCLKEKFGDVTLCTLDGKTWSAKYLRYETSNKYPKAVLYDGWRKFMQENKLEPGDVCVFEVIEQTKILLKVVIYRVTQDSNGHSPLGGVNSSANGGDGRLSTQRSTKIGPLNSHEKARAILRASNFKSENPFFMVVMQPAYLKSGGKGNSVYIPYKFAKRYFDAKEKVILQVSDGRSWILKCSVKVMACGQHKAKFYHSWGAFAEDNNLKVGDVCVFELINLSETSFKVSIF